MNLFEVVVCGVVNKYLTKTFRVKAINVLHAQVRVLKRIKGIAHTTMYQILSAQEINGKR